MGTGSVGPLLCWEVPEHNAILFAVVEEFVNTMEEINRGRVGPARQYERDARAHH